MMLLLSCLHEDMTVQEKTLMTELVTVTHCGLNRDSFSYNTHNMTIRLNVIFKVLMVLTFT